MTVSIRLSELESQYKMPCSALREFVIQMENRLCVQEEMIDVLFETIHEMDNELKELLRNKRWKEMIERIIKMGK